eukprot:gene11935-10309_t
MLDGLGPTTRSRSDINYQPFAPDKFFRLPRAALSFSGGGAPKLPGQGQHQQQHQHQQ